MVGEGNNCERSPGGGIFEGSPKGEKSGEKENKRMDLQEKLAEANMECNTSVFLEVKLEKSQVYSGKRVRLWMIVYGRLAAWDSEY
jgi:hypothetical protein